MYDQVEFISAIYFNIRKSNAATSVDDEEAAAFAKQGTGEGVLVATSFKPACLFAWWRLVAAGKGFKSQLVNVIDSIIAPNIHCPSLRGVYFPLHGWHTW